MKTYRVKVFEMREYSCWYTVQLDEQDIASGEADGMTPEQLAVDLAENGETIDEEEIDLIGVTDRNVDDNVPIEEIEGDDD
jgi:hypothetical protein